jgi:hypothetical protein
MAEDATTQSSELEESDSHEDEGGEEASGEESASGVEEKILEGEAGVFVPSEEAEASQRRGGLPVDFGGFVVSLGTSALVNMGRVPDPETGETIVNLEAARHTIDILKMLRDKTEGNLDVEEQKLVDSLLYDLKMAFVEVQKQQGVSGKKN